MNLKELRDKVKNETKPQKGDMVVISSSVKGVLRGRIGVVIEEASGAFSTISIPSLGMIKEFYNGNFEVISSVSEK